MPIRLTNRWITVLYAVIGIWLFAIAYFGPNERLAFALRMLVLTASVVLAVYGLFRRDLSILMIGGGLFLETIDPSKRILIHAGIALFLGGVALMWWKHRKNMISRPTGT